MGMSGVLSDLESYSINLNNVTEVTIFILMGFTNNIELKLSLCFFLFLAIYLFTLIGNLGVVVLIIGDSQLHNPIYYFLSMLSFLDACYSSVVTPKMLVNFLAENKAISFIGCGTQMVFVVVIVTFGTTECFLLGAVAYDCYVAIYNPLRYSVNVSQRAYLPLIISSYVDGILHAILHTVSTFSLSFCASNEIRHVLWDIPLLLAISCFDTHSNQLLLFCFMGFIEISSILIVLITYAFILLAILKMRSAEGMQKVFSTCGSHLTGVSIFHGTIPFRYVRPDSSYSLDHDMILSIFYTIVIPMFNPVMHSLKNKDVKKAIKKLFEIN